MFDLIRQEAHLPRDKAFRVSLWSTIIIRFRDVSSSSINTVCDSQVHAEALRRGLPQRPGELGSPRGVELCQCVQGLCTAV